MKMHRFVGIAVLLLVAADAPKEDPTKADVAKIQGLWKCVSSEIYGKPSKEADASALTMTFKDDKVESSENKGKNPKSKTGTFKLNASKSPKEFDMTISERGNDTTLTLNGIYELDGDTLKMCYRADGKRPTKFDSGDSDITILIKLKREKADATKIQGVWKCVGGEADGEALPDAAAAAVKFTFKDDKVEISSSNKTDQQKCPFKLNANKTPKEIDITSTVRGKENTLKGIYEIDGDTLKICLPKRADTERPTKFATPTPKELNLLKFKREKS